MAPTSLHEQRVELLTAVAAMGGCRSAVELDGRLRPDVALADHRTRRLFVGDAKATETVGCQATGRRLRRYLRAAVPWCRVGYRLRVVLCASPSSGRREDGLVTLAAAVGLRTSTEGTITVGAQHEFSWVDIPSTAEVSPAG
jgi:hypothetical protein